jgi:hypothetical protein
MFIPEVPKNSLTTELEDLVRLCIALNNDENNNWTNIFCEPATAEAIDKWENKNGVKLPVSYREFLAFSNGAIVRTNLLDIYALDEIVKLDIDPYGDVFVIARLIGDGESLYFLSDGELMRGYFGDGDKTVLGIGKILTQTIQMAADELPENIKETLTTLQTKEAIATAKSIANADKLLYKLLKRQLEEQEREENSESN